MAYAYTHNARATGIAQSLTEGDLRVRRLYVNITTATTTDILSGQGWLHKIIVNGGTMGAITIYDEAGTATDNKIGIISATGLVPGATFAYDVPVARGIRITTAGNTDITVILTI